MFPDFIVIGGHKCGSTYIQDVLDEHPDIFLTPGETAYFQDPDYLETNINDFEKLFDKVQSYQAIGIKRPDYLAKDECPARIKKHLPNAKLIVILRNPVSRAIAAYFHYIKTGFAPPLPLNDGMKKVLDRSLYNEFPRTSEIVEYGFYYKHLQKYFACFDEKQIHIILLDDLKKNNLTTIKQLYGFLHVKSDFIPHKSMNKKPQKVIYSIVALKLITRVNQLNYTYSSDKMRLYPKDSTIIGKIRLKAINGIFNFLASQIFINTKPQASRALQQRLYAIYEEDIVQLEQLIKRDLSVWKEPFQKVACSQ